MCTCVLSKASLTSLCPPLLSSSNHLRHPTCNHQSHSLPRSLPPKHITILPPQYASATSCIIPPFMYTLDCFPFPFLVHARPSRTYVPLPVCSFPNLLLLSCCIFENRATGTTVSLYQFHSQIISCNLLYEDSAVRSKLTDGKSTVFINQTLRYTADVYEIL